ncbi:MAG: TusE/DsrC/DsvC family sulfur relay protein [Betaproteobacteria bacterium]|nr:TusE/DsrC/DsvC family sulfur relay protein [Betaproteobacteria bacterium]
MIKVNGREIETDAEGYLASLDDWSEDVAQCLAERDQLALADEHWQVVRWIREYYAVPFSA